MRLKFWKGEERVPFVAHGYTLHRCAPCGGYAVKDGTRPPAGWVSRLERSGVVFTKWARVLRCPSCWAAHWHTAVDRPRHRKPRAPFWRNTLVQLRARREAFEALRPVWRRRW